MHSNTYSSLSGPLRHMFIAVVESACFYAYPPEPGGNGSLAIPASSVTPSEYSQSCHVSTLKVVTCIYQGETFSQWGFS